VKRALELNLDGIVITEHGMLWDEEEIKELKEETEANDFIILRGQEVTCWTSNGNFHGDLLLFGYFDIFEKRLTAVEVIDRVHKKDGIVIAAHPFRQGYGFGKDVFDLNLDGIEVLHPHHYLLDIKRAVLARKSLDVAELGGSDAHSVDDIGYYLTSFSREIRTEDDLVREIIAKNCKAITLKNLRRRERNK
jgi:predicted metal-dependent phosphoesterase TrpH